MLETRPVGTIGTDTRRVRIEQPGGAAGDYLWQSQWLPAEGWTIHLLHDTRSAVRAARIAALAAAGGWLTLVFLGLFLHQRWRLARLRQRSRAELEQLVKQHTAELQSAQDTLVQAAHLAVQGRDESLEHLPQGVSVVDADLRLRAWNRRYVELFSLPPELMVSGRPVEDILRYNARRGLLGPGNPDEAVQRRLEHLRVARPYVFEREWPDGRVLEIRGNPLPGGGFVTSYADITTYKSAARQLRTLAETLERRVERRTQELQAAKAEAERANRSKTRFVAAAVHDLLQPLNAARMFVSALQARVQDPAERDLAANVEDALVAQDAILTSLLDIARLESGAIETCVRDIALGALFEALSREFGIVAQAKGLSLECVATSAVVRSDQALLRRILQNFLSNAIRYTRHGRIVLGCRRSGGDVRIEVWDTGPGIPEHLRAEIFEEFRRIDQAQGGERGAGLGLAIVDRIAHLLKHPIGLRSWVGRGSMFSISVPQGDPAGVDQRIVTVSVNENSALAGRCVWYIEDDARVRAGTSALLERWGCHVVLSDGSGSPLSISATPLLQSHEEIQRAQLSAVPGSDPRPDLLLLDYRLGERTGPDLLPELRARWGSLPPVIIVSAERGPAVEGMARAKGWGYIPKPVRPAALRALMTRMLPGPSPAKPPVSGCDTPACAEQP
jgi:histidine kinase